jgi:hypothetical protein
MNLPIDTSVFPTGAPDIDYEEGDLGSLRILAEEARLAVESFRWAPPIKDIVLAFGVAPILGLFLVRFSAGITSGEGQGDTECWVVVGDVPAICFETDVATPRDALKLYCAIAQDWADNVLAGASLADSYPIAAAANHEHAKMLLSRLEFIREKLMPLA